MQSLVHRRNGPAEMTTQEFEMTNYASSLLTQVGVGFVSFLISAACIVSAAGPVHLVG